MGGGDGDGDHGDHGGDDGDRRDGDWQLNREKGWK